MMEFYNSSIVSRFNRIEDAERFIITLRQHTPFHPSFAKVHSTGFTLLVMI